MNKVEFTASAVDPKTFHLDCVDHLCRLEIKLAELPEGKEAGPSSARLSAVTSILAEVTDFAQPRFSTAVFDGIAERIHDLYKRTCAIRDVVESLSWSVRKRVLKDGGSTQEAKHLLDQYATLQTDLKQFLVEYFVTCVKRFDTAPEAKKFFLESVDSFIDDVEKAWN